MTRHRWAEAPHLLGIEGDPGTGFRCRRPRQLIDFARIFGIVALAGCNVGQTSVHRTAEYRTTPERWRSPEPLMATNFRGMLVEIPRAHARVVEERHDRVVLDAPVTEPSGETPVGAILMALGLGALAMGYGGAMIVNDCPRDPFHATCGMGTVFGAGLMLGGIGGTIFGLAMVDESDPMVGPFSVALDDPLPEDLEGLSGLGLNLTWEPDVDGPPAVPTSEE